MMRRWFVFAGIILVAACSAPQKDTLEIKGVVANINSLALQYPEAVKNGAISILLYEIPFGGDQQPVQLDSVAVTANQKTFTLKGLAPHKSMYNVMVSNGPAIPLINDAANIGLSIDFAAPERFYTVSGSEASMQLRDFMFTYNDKSIAIDQTMSQLDSLKQFGASDSVLIATTNRKNQALQDLNNYLRSFLSGTNQPIVATFALGRSARTLPTNEFEQQLTKLTQQFPEDTNLKELKNRFETYKAQAQAQQQQRTETTASLVGKPAPELTMPDVNGKNVSLSSFKGKYVLVDFWASWCGPCRGENPHVVAAYNQFKNKNFTVLGVSLDRKKENWLQAIEEDHLTWPQISDLAYWNSKAVSIFGFNAIPYNVLVDPQGTIIAESLRGDELINKLKEVVK